MWTRRANLWSCPNGSLLYWQPTRYCWVLRRSLSEWCLRSILFGFFHLFIWRTFVYLQDIYHGFICKPYFSLLSKDQPSHIYGGRPSWLLKCLISADLSTFHVSSSIWTFSGCHWFHIWKHHVLSFLDQSGCNQLKSFKCYGAWIVSAQSIECKAHSSPVAIAETFWCLQYCIECFWQEQLPN
jgi:hypothetical protein